MGKVRKSKTSVTGRLSSWEAEFPKHLAAWSWAEWGALRRIGWGDVGGASRRLADTCHGLVPSFFPSVLLPQVPSPPQSSPGAPRAVQPTSHVKSRGRAPGAFLLYPCMVTRGAGPRVLKPGRDKARPEPTVAQATQSPPREPGKGKTRERTAGSRRL